MHPARFVDLLFVYAGVVLVLQAGFFNGWELGPGLLSQAVTGVAVLLFPVVRARQPVEERTPSRYGPFVYAFVGLCLLLTALLIVAVVSS